MAIKDWILSDRVKIIVRTHVFCLSWKWWPISSRRIHARKIDGFLWIPFSSCGYLFHPTL
jgi:hypothetical protein